MPEGGDVWSKKLHGGVMRDWREIRDCDLFDVSCVTYPAYNATSANVDDDEDEEDGRGLKALAAVAGRSNTPIELRSRIAAVAAARDRLKRGPDINTTAGRAEYMRRLSAEVAADAPVDPYEHTERLLAETQAERILQGLKG